MTLAVADALLHDADMAVTLRSWGRRYETTCGVDFQDWVDDDKGSYGSWGNDIGDAGVGRLALDHVRRLHGDGEALRRGHARPSGWRPRPAPAPPAPISGA